MPDTADELPDSSLVDDGDEQCEVAPKTRGRKRAKKVNKSQRVTSDDDLSPTSREILSETRVIDSPVRGFHQRDLSVRDTVFLNSNFDPTTTPLCIPYKRSDNFRKKYQLKFFDVLKPNFSVCVSDLHQDLHRCSCYQ